MLRGETNNELQKRKPFPRKSLLRLVDNIRKYFVYTSVSQGFFEKVCMKKGLQKQTTNMYRHINNKI